MTLFAHTDAVVERLVAEQGIRVGADLVGRLMRYTRFHGHRTDKPANSAFVIRTPETAPAYQITEVA